MPDRMFFTVTCGACNEDIHILERKADRKFQLLNKSIVVEHDCKSTGLSYLLEVSRGFKLKNPKQPKDEKSNDPFDPEADPDKTDPRDYG